MVENRQTKKKQMLPKKGKTFVPSEARPKAELRSPEAELFSSLKNWVVKEKKVDIKKKVEQRQRR